MQTSTMHTVFKWILIDYCKDLLKSEGILLLMTGGLQLVLSWVEIKARQFG